MLRFPALSTAIATAAGLPLSDNKEGQGGIVATWEATIEKSHAAFYTAHRAPATEASLKHTRLARFTRGRATRQDEQNRL